MVDDFIVEITISIILLGVGYVWSKLNTKIQVTDPVRKLWGINDPNNIVIVVATSVSTDTGKYIRRSTGIGQVRALGASVESLSKVYDIKLDNILFCEDCMSNQIEKDIIVLGGPKNNNFTRLIFEKLRYKGIDIFQIDNTIYWNVGEKKKEYTAITDCDKNVTKDYGLIIQGRNPFCSKNKTSFCLFSGSHTYGTIASAKYFTEQYIDDTKKSSCIITTIKAMLVECDIINGHTCSIKIIEQYEL